MSWPKWPGRMRDAWTWGARRSGRARGEFAPAQNRRLDVPQHAGRRRRRRQAPDAPDLVGELAPVVAGHGARVGRRVPVAAVEREHVPQQARVRDGAVAELVPPAPERRPRVALFRRHLVDLRGGPRARLGPRDSADAAEPRPLAPAEALDARAALAVGELLVAAVGDAHGRHHGRLGRLLLAPEARGAERRDQDESGDGMSRQRPHRRGLPRSELN